MKKLSSFSALTIVALLFFACVSSSPIVWDDAIPEAETASVYFYYLNPTSYNGVSVEWGSFRTARIPGGDAEFSANVVSSGYAINDAIFSYRFEQGADYTVAFGTKEVEGGRLIVGVGIYEGINVVKESALLDFIPFSNKN
jgi:hypothetical protein